MGYTGQVFLHTGATTSSLFGNGWDKTPTIWESNAPNNGLMTNTGTNEWSITLPSIRNFYNLDANENAYKIQFLFRSENGNLTEGNGCTHASFLVNNSSSLSIIEPSGKFLTKELNQPFRITGYSTSIADFNIKINNLSVHTETGVKRSSFIYTPTTAGNHEIKIESTINGNTLTKTINFTVCNSTSIANPVALPANLNHGINYSNDPTKATLVLHAPTENINSVHIIGDFNNWTVNCSYLMNYDASKKVFWKEISNLNSGQEYVFQYLIDGKTRIGDSYTHKVSDPWNDSYIPATTYPNLIAYPPEAMAINGQTPTIASVLQTNKPVYQWETSNFKRISSNKLNIYQLHFRDFTEEGTYLAAIEKLDYIQRMGINAIETLPVSEFEGNDSWGYNPNYYFAVDKAYGTENDYKKFVDECHKRGIAVIGDIVLNHAFGTNPMARMYWNEINSRPESNNPWFNVKTNFDNPGANWGNDFNHESPHTQAFVDSVIRFWVKEYKIDGIRFDFTKGFGNTPYPNANCGDEWGGCYDANRVALLKNMATKMWAIDNGATGSAPYVIMEHLATLSEDKALADFGINLWSGVTPNHKYAEIAMGYAPSSSDPNKSNISDAYYKNKTFNLANWVSYMESHDEERLAFLAKTYGNGTIKTDLGVRSQFLQNAAVMNLLLTGPRQIWQFGELGYDFSIDFNGRTGRKPVRWDYFDIPERKKIYDTYKKLFWLRNNLPNTFHKDIDNTGGNKTDFVSQFKRFHFYSSVGDTAVTILANTANSVISGNPSFNSNDTQWYEYFTRQTEVFNNPSTTNITLQPGEFRIYFNKPLYQNAPEISLSSHTNSIGNPTTNIILNFDKEIEKVDGITSQALNEASIGQLFELKDASNNVIPFIGQISFTNKSIIIDPSNNLPNGNYTLICQPNTLQNYGGIKITSPINFNFAVNSSVNPCPNNVNLTSTSDDLNSETKSFQASQTITASNKINANSKVELKAGKYIILNPGFKAEASPNYYTTIKTGACE